MTIWISRELSLFNFERLDMLGAWIGLLSENYDHWYFSWLSVVQFRASRYIMRLNRTSEWNVMTIWISRELPLFNFERLDILCPWIRHSYEKLLPLEFSRASVDQVWTPRYLMRLNRPSEWKVMTIWILESFCCWISSVSIYYVLESDIRVKSYDYLYFSKLSVVKFRASRYIMSLNRTFERKVMTTWILESFPCSISSV